MPSSDTKFNAGTIKCRNNKRVDCARRRKAKTMIGKGAGPVTVPLAHAIEQATPGQRVCQHTAISNCLLVHEYLRLETVRSVDTTSTSLSDESWDSIRSALESTQCSEPGEKREIRLGCAPTCPTSRYREEYSRNFPAMAHKGA